MRPHDISEPLARSAFQILLSESGVRTQRWRPGREPPDYYLRADGVSYAVEVTQVLDRVGIGGLVLTTSAVRGALRAIAKEVQARADAACILSGLYVIALAPVVRLCEQRAALCKEALDYIQRTQSASTAAPETIGHGTLNTPITITKRKSAPNGVWPSTPIRLSQRSPQLERDLLESIAGRMASKRKKLCRVRLPVVLLLLDGFGYAEVNWQVLARSLDFTGYHTVGYVAGTCNLLHTSNAAWRTAV